MGLDQTTCWYGTLKLVEHMASPNTRIEVELAERTAAFVRDSRRK